MTAISTAEHLDFLSSLEEVVAGIELPPILDR